MLSQAEKTLERIEPDAEKKQNIMKKIFLNLAHQDLNVPAPFIARELHKIISEQTGIKDTFKHEKELGNANAIALKPVVEEIINNSDNRLEASLRAAISGNIIDYGAATGSGEINIIKEALDCAMNEDLAGEKMAVFAKENEKAKNILYIGDNTGEIVFDTFLVRELSAVNKTFVVRGQNILNDATIEDACLVSMDSYAKVISTGDHTPGIDINRMSDDLIGALKNADMIIAKGQGNLETLYDADISPWTAKGTPVYFLFKVKCRHVSSIVGLPMGATAILRKNV